MAWYPGQPKICGVCQDIGHDASACPIRGYVAFVGPLAILRGLVRTIVSPIHQPIRGKLVLLFQSLPLRLLHLFWELRLQMLLLLRLLLLLLLSCLLLLRLLMLLLLKQLLPLLLLLRLQLVL